MGWQVSAIADLVIMLAYLGLVVAIVRPLVATRRVRSSLLGATTALILLTCAAWHGWHAWGDDAFTPSLAIWDVFAVLAAGAYWAQRHDYTALVEGNRLFDDLEDSARRAGDHAALMRVATAIAREVPTPAVMALVAQESARVVGASVARVVRFEGEVGVSIGAHPGPLDAADPLAHSLASINEVARTGLAARASYGEADTDDPVRALVDEAGLRCEVAAPIQVEGRLWGAIAVASTTHAAMTQQDEERLMAFADLVAVATENSEMRSWLLRQAATDPLTGLLNHRSFHDRLREEVERASRSGAPLSLAMLDLDFFKRVNDVHGHRAGDRVLTEIARRLRAAARTGDIVARLGGEEFAWLMPDTAAPAAQIAVERLRRAVMGRPFESAGTLTVSAGVCELAEAGGSDELLHLVDTALYWAKDRGRNRSCVYAADAIGERSAQERAERLGRDANLRSLSALARSVDARDQSLAWHSERVAELAFRLALARGWTRDDADRLRSAALVHDVGKIGVPDAILLKPAPLSEDERAIVEMHAALGAEIVADGLAPVQVAWVRHHHERWDGSGYPDCFHGEAIPEGARLLAVADAWDVMTNDRCYGSAMTLEAALRELRRCAGTQFCPQAVTALIDTVQVHSLPDRSMPLAVSAGA